MPSVGECRNKKAAAYTSVAITFIALLIILHHVYTYTSVFSKIKSIKSMKMLKKMFLIHTCK
jgi:hypothetical protein